MTAIKNINIDPSPSKMETVAPITTESSVRQDLKSYDLEALRRDGAEIGYRVSIHPEVSIEHPEKLVIGDDVRIGPGVRMRCAGGLIIGARTIVESGVQILSSTPKIPIGNRWKISEAGMRNVKIHIDEDVLIGPNAVLMPGIYLGIGVIVGPGTVLTQRVSEYKFVRAEAPNQTILRDRMQIQYNI